MLIEIDVDPAIVAFAYDQMDVAVYPSRYSIQYYVEAMLNRVGRKEVGHYYWVDMGRRDYSGQRGEYRVPMGFPTRDVGEHGFALMPIPDIPWPTLDKVTLS
jgi:hypothetical protein